MSSKIASPAPMRSVFLHQPDRRVLQLRYRDSCFWRLRIWLPAVFAVGCIAVESTATFSSEHTSHWLRPIYQTLFGAIDDAAWANVHHLIRKTGHFLGYGLVCLTFLRAWLLTLGSLPHLTERAWRLRASVFAVLSTALVASADEFHQTFLPSRTGRISDVVLDTCGALALCLLMACINGCARAVAVRR